MKSSHLRNTGPSKKFSIILQGAICAVSLFLIVPAAKSDEKIPQANEYVSVFMLKVRSDLARDDYSDPGWYKHPEGHQAYEYSGELPEVSERFTPGNSLMAPKSELASANFKAVKPNHRKS